MYRLTLHLSGRPIQSFHFDQEAIHVGRDPECEIQIDNIGISRRHATIEIKDGEYVLTDLRSHNGTFVQGRRIYSHKLMENDEFFIGKYSLAFENLDVAIQKPAKPSLGGGAMQDMTFRLDREEIDRLMGSSAMSRSPMLVQLSPEREVRTLPLERYYYLLGKDKKATIQLGGLFTPAIAAALIKNDKYFHVIALGKRCRVRVNGVEIRDQQLADGDMIEVCGRRFRFSKS